MRGETRKRMAIRLSIPVMTALELVAERNGLPPATQAMMLLRQALSRTMDSREFAETMERRHGGGLTRGEWLEEQRLAAEVLYAEEAEARAAAQAEATVHAQ